MKVTLFNTAKKWGGGEKWHAEMGALLNENNVAITCFARKNSRLFQKLKTAGIECVPTRVGNLSFLNPFKLFQLYRLLKNVSPDILIMNLPSDLKTAGLAARLAGIKHIIYRRGSAIPLRNSWTNRLIFKYIVTEMIVNSDETLRTVRQNNPEIFPLEKIHLIYNGIDTEPYFSSSKAFHKSTHEIVLGNLARLSYQKGQFVLIDLAERLREDGYKFKILIGGIGELEQELKTLVQKKKLDDQVQFMGFVENPYDFLNQIDIFVFPSIWEGFGYSIVEAKLAKKPVVAFQVSSNPEVIQNDIDGFLVPLNNLDAFYEATKRLMDAPGLIEKMGKSGHQDVLNRFTQTKAVGHLISFLRTLPA
ncbi:MAG: glycosyltransferase [Salinivirgaceae bacterium]